MNRLLLALVALAVPAAAIAGSNNPGPTYTVQMFDSQELIDTQGATSTRENQYKPGLDDKVHVWINAGGSLPDYKLLVARFLWERKTSPNTWTASDFARPLSGDSQTVTISGEQEQVISTSLDVPGNVKALHLQLSTTSTTTVTADAWASGK